MKNMDIKPFQNATKPFKNPKDEYTYIRYLEQKDKRLFIYYTIARAGGFRCNEIRTMTVGELRAHLKNGEFRIYQSKVDEYRVVPIVSEKTIQILEEYIKDKYDNEYLIPSRQTKEGKLQPLSYRQLQKLLKKYGKELGFDRVGTHTPRKSYGHHNFKSNLNVGKEYAMKELAESLGQKSVTAAARYADVYEDVQRARVESTKNPIDLYY